MKETIYIDGECMDLEAGKVNVQLIYQSPILLDFQQIVSNRTTQVSLPATTYNLRAIGYTGTQAVSDFAYRYHTVIYKRDGLQLLKGNATLLSIGKGSITMCFTWGNVTAIKSLFDLKLRNLGGANEVYSAYPPNDALNPNNVIEVNYGGGRKGVGVRVADVLTRIENECGVTGLSELADANEDGSLKYALALTTRNGNLQTRYLQGTNLGLLATSNWQANLDYVTALTVRGGSDPHQYMDSYGVMDLSASNKVLVHAGGWFRINFGYNFSQPATPIGLRLLYYRNDATGWNINRSYLLCEATPAGAQAYDFIVNHDVTYDCSTWDACCLCVLWDTVAQAATPQVIVSECECNIIPDPDKEDEVIYGSSLANTYPVFFNLPDMSCGQFVKNLLWLHGAFAYSKDGRELQIVTFNDIMGNKAQAVDWTNKLKGMPTERQFRLDGTAQQNLFRYAEADYYDNTQYQGVLETEDETIDNETEYCKSDFAITPGNLIPAWTNNDGQWDYTEYPCAIIVSSGARKGKYYTMQDWRNILASYYEQYAEIIQRPVQIKATVILTTLDLHTLDLTVPVYLKQTGHYYLIRKLSVKGASEAEVELIKI